MLFVSVLFILPTLVPFFFNSFSHSLPSSRPPKACLRIGSGVTSLLVKQELCNWTALLPVCILYKLGWQWRGVQSYEKKKKILMRFVYWIGFFGYFGMSLWISLLCIYVSKLGLFTAVLQRKLGAAALGVKLIVGNLHLKEIARRIETESNLNNIYQCFSNSLLKYCIRTYCTTGADNDGERAALTTVKFRIVQQGPQTPVSFSVQGRRERIIIDFT